MPIKLVALRFEAPLSFAAEAAFTLLVASKVLRYRSE
jgi:hypothetical protein